MKKGKKIIIGILAVLLTLAGAFWVYTLDYYHPGFPPTHNYAGGVVFSAS